MLLPSNIYAFSVQYLCFCIVISMLLQNESKVIAFCSLFPIPSFALYSSVGCTFWFANLSDMIIRIYQFFIALEEIPCRNSWSP